MARICPLFSGSGGNGYYIGGKEHGILIDIGRSARQTDKILDAAGLGAAAVEGIFITHEHTDHIAGVRVFASKHNIPVYAAEETFLYMEKNGGLPKNADCRELSKLGTQCADMLITPFAAPHDSAACCGFRVNTADGRTVTLSTDLGYITEEVNHSLLKTDFAIIESNHDIDMLRHGSYPYYLKERILSQSGHLSNKDCAEEIAGLAQNGSTYFMLAHLSHENNTPRTAFKESFDMLSSCGLKKDIDYKLYVAPTINEEGRSIIF